MNATNKNTLAAANTIQSNSAEATPSALLARILDLETVAADALAALRKQEADDLAKAATAPAPSDVIAGLQAQLDALKEAQKSA